MAKLSARQRAFVREYLKDKNGARAARAAGYSHKGSNVTGSQLLAKPNIRAAVDSGLARLAAKCEITAERVLNRLAEFAFEKKKIKASDSLRATELIGKHLKLFTDVTESKVDATLVTVDEAQVKAAREKIKSDC